MSALDNIAVAESMIDAKCRIIDETARQGRESKDFSPYVTQDRSTGCREITVDVSKLPASWTPVTKGSTHIRKGKTLVIDTFRGVRMAKSFADWLAKIEPETSWKVQAWEMVGDGSTQYRTVKTDSVPVALIARDAGKIKHRAPKVAGPVAVPVVPETLTDGQVISLAG